MNTLFQTITTGTSDDNADDKVVQMSMPATVKKQSKIIIRDLELIMSIGILDEEKEQKQKVIINLELEVKPNPDWKQDNIDAVISYADIIAEIEQMAQREHINLVETFAEQIAEICFYHNEVMAATIRVDKPDIIDNTASVGVELSVQR